MKLSIAATHLCAAAALGYALRAARFERSWVRVPVVREAIDAPSLSIVVPARNEERSIERCVRSLLAQRLADYEVIVVDDRSSDRTRAMLEALARDEPRLRVVDGAELPDGWVGKSWALHQGALHARGEWLLFTDADSVHQPFSAPSTLAFARAQGVDAVSIATYQELGSFAERAVLPSILGMILFAIGPLGAINDPARPEHALANGQYILVSRRAYDALGGHEALKGEIVEDIEFARRLKRDGRFRLLLAGGEELAAVRMYRSLREIWNGFTKNVYFGPGGDPGALTAGIVFLSAISYLPPLLALHAARRRRPWEALEALACTAATIATASRAIGKTRLDRRLGWFQPLGTAVLAAIAVNSTLRVVSGRGVEWSGRRYAATERDSQAARVNPTGP